MTKTGSLNIVRPTLDFVDQRVNVRSLSFPFTMLPLFASLPETRLFTTQVIASK